MVERWKIIDGGNAIEATVTFDDPGAFNGALVGLSALDQIEWADRGIGVRGKQRELWEIPRSFRISDAGGDNAGLLIDFHVYIFERSHLRREGGLADTLTGSGTELA